MSLLLLLLLLWANTVPTLDERLMFAWRRLHDLDAVKRTKTSGIVLRIQMVKNTI